MKHSSLRSQLKCWLLGKPDRKILFLDPSDFYLVTAFFLLFTLLTPLGLYKTGVPFKIQTGYYSVINPDKGDDAAYYSYLRSIYFDGDIDFYNEKGYAHSEKILHSGYVFNHWAPGPAIFWTPFFFLGHLFAHLLKSSVLDVSVDGYSFPYYISTAVGSILFSFTGIYLLSKLLCRFYERKIAYFSSFIVFASTALVYFTFIRQRMAHSLEFMLVVIFLFLYIKVREQKYDFKWMALWGTSIGALFLTRHTDITFLIIPALDFCYCLYVKWKAKTKSSYELKGYGYFTASFIITIVPLFIVWQILNGIPLPISWTQYPSHFFSFDFPGLVKKIYHFFLGGDWGVFISEPIWLIALPGLWLFIKKEPFYGILFCMVGVFPIYISANPGGGASEASFGHRFALALNPILTFGVAATLSKTTQNKSVYRTLLFVCCLFVIYKYVQLIQYKVILAHNDPQFTIHSIKNFIFILENSELWIRSTSVWKTLFYIKEFELIDFIFTLMFPLSVFLGMYSIVAVFNLSIKCKWSITHSLFLVSLIVLFLYAVLISVYNTKSPEEKINRYFDRAIAYLMKREPRKAVLDLESALQIDRKSIKVLNALGEIYTDFLGDKKRGESYFKKALSTFPNQQKTNLKILMKQKEETLIRPKK